MSTLRNRLEKGERWWAAELVARTAGLVLLGASAFAARCIASLVDQPPPHLGTPLELGLAAIAFACLSTGLALLFEGPGLLRRVPTPPRALIP